VERARAAALIAEADQLTAAWSQAVQTASAAWETGDPADALANATLYLQGFGHVVLAWVWLDIAAGAVASQHAEGPGKVAAMRYFFSYELPKVGPWLDVVARREALCRDLDVELL
jgi:butyryl-CoA dehydrogenase